MNKKDFNFEITKNAINRIIELKKLENNPSLKFKISVDAGGCSGLMYNFDLTEDKHEFDLIIKSHKEEVLIDSLSIEFINNSILDYVEELGASYFQITNPNAKFKCGCGNSFAT